MYTQDITRRHRTAFILVVDRSASMQEMVRVGMLKMTKSQALTLITSSILQELIDRCRRDESVRDYYDVAVIGYGDGKVELLFGEKGFISLEQLAQLNTKSHTIAFEAMQPDGECILIEKSIRVWFEPKAEGNTPMYEALLKARELIAEWCSRPQNLDSFPPMIINISDGEFSDCHAHEMMDLATTIKREGTCDGSVLFVNVHLEPNSDCRSLVFPDAEEMEGFNPTARLMADISSDMPEPFTRDIMILKGRRYADTYKGMAYNANIVELISMLEIGSRSGPPLQ